jgi:hypothetical protein
MLNRRFRSQPGFQTAHSFPSSRRPPGPRLATSTYAKSLGPDFRRDDGLLFGIMTYNKFYSQFSANKSRQSGFVFSINSSFQVRFHSFNCFSRLIAAAAIPVLRNAAAKIAGHSDVKCSIPFAGKNINSWLHFFAHHEGSLLSVIFVIPADAFLTSVIPANAGTQAFRSSSG